MTAAGPYDCSECGKTHPRGCRSHRSASGEPCGNHPIPGGTVCRYHGGRAPQVQAAAARRLALEGVSREAGRLGLVLDVDPLDALVESVHEAAANVAVLRLELAELRVQVSADGAIAVPDPKTGRFEARVHVLVALYNDERDRMVRYAKLCLDAGVDERRVRLAEAQGQLLARVVQAAVDACDPTPQERAAATQAAARVMRQIGAGEGMAA